MSRHEDGRAGKSQERSTPRTSNPFQRCLSAIVLPSLMVCKQNTKSVTTASRRGASWSNANSAMCRSISVMASQNCGHRCRRVPGKRRGESPHPQELPDERQLPDCNATPGVKLGPPPVSRPEKSAVVPVLVFWADRHKPRTLDSWPDRRRACWMPTSPRCHVLGLTARIQIGPARWPSFGCRTASGHCQRPCAARFTVGLQVSTARRQAARSFGWRQGGMRPEGGVGASDDRPLGDWWKLALALTSEGRLLLSLVAHPCNPCAASASARQSAARPA